MVQPHAIEQYHLLQLGIAIQAQLVFDHSSSDLAGHLPLGHLVLGQMVCGEMATVNIGVEVILIGGRSGDRFYLASRGIEDLVVLLDGSEVHHDCDEEVEREMERKVGNDSGARRAGTQ